MQDRGSYHWRGSGGCGCRGHQGRVPRDPGGMKGAWGEEATVPHGPSPSLIPFITATMAEGGGWSSSVHRVQER